MKDYISELKKAKDLYKNSTLHIDLNNKVNDAKHKIKKQQLELQEMEQNISLKERKKVMHKTEILKNKILAEKNNERFNAENNKHLENCQEQVKIEAAIYNTEDEIETLKSTMKELEQKLNESKVCLHDKIFLELIKGLGVEYNESEKSFVVRNITKNEIRTFKASDKNLTDKIWGFLAI